MREEWFSVEPGVMCGKPCFRGTRITVEHVLRKAREGASAEQIAEWYPQIDKTALRWALSIRA